MPTSFAERVRAFGWFLIAAAYFGITVAVAHRAARGLVSPEWTELAQACISLFLLVVGYAAMGTIGQHQASPVRAMGLDTREGWLREIALGAALGWGGLVAAVLPIALFGVLTIQVDTHAHQWLLFAGDLVLLAVAALGEEVAFRGYPFQRLIAALGPMLATLFMAALFMGAHAFNPDATAASLLTTFLAGWLLSLAYLRTRALWVPWGFHFAWNASMGLLFGLPVSGLTIFSPVVSSYTRGPVWMTGGGYGPEGSAITIFVLLVLVVVLVRATRDLKHRYAGPVLIPGGIPVDLDAISRRQHEQAMGPGAPAAQPLVQILPPAAPSPLPQTPASSTGNEERF